MKEKIKEILADVLTVWLPLVIFGLALMFAAYLFLDDAHIKDDVRNFCAATNWSVVDKYPVWQDGVKYCHCQKLVMQDETLTRIESYARC